MKNLLICLGILFSYRMITAQNVGIGIATPQGKLHISGGYATTGMAAPGNSFYMNANGASPNAGQIIWGDNTGWKLHFGTVAGGNFQPRVTMEDLGYVGIGTISPNAKLEVSGNSVATTEPQLRLFNPNSGTGTTAGLRMNTAGGWNIKLQTVENRDWLQITDAGGGIVHAFQGNRYYPGSTSNNGTNTGYITGNGINIAIGTPTPNASALLQVQSTDKGVLLPQVSLVAANNPAPITPAPAVGLLVYNIATSGTGANIVTPGHYYWDGTRWQRFQTNAYAGIVQGTFAPTDVDLTTNAPGWQYTNASITLPPGKWVVFGTVLLTPNTGTFTSGACWVRSSFSNSNVTFSYSPDIIGSPLISGALVAPCIYGLVTGQVVINNTSMANKTYYYWANKENMGGYTGGINGYAWTSWGENQLFAIPAN